MSLSQALATMSAKAKEAETAFAEAQQHWDKQVEKMRTNTRQMKEEDDADRAEFQAEIAESDAEFAVSMATAAIEEAQYASLNAVLKREKADELAKALANR